MGGTRQRTAAVVWVVTTSPQLAIAVAAAAAMTRSAAAESPAATLAGDAARLWQMMEAGHPVLKTQAGRVMKQLGSTEIGDEAAFTSFVGRNKQLLHQ